MSNGRRQDSGTGSSRAGRQRHQSYDQGGSGRPNIPLSIKRTAERHQRYSQGETRGSLQLDSHGETRKGQQTTCWSYYHEGNVVIPEICVYSIDKRCAYEDKGCLRLHAKCTSQWQVLKDSNWYNFRNFHSKEIEDAFEDVTKDKGKITVLDPKKMGKSAQGMIKILGTEEWEADFQTMTLRSTMFKGSLSGSMNIRRLSTQSAALSKSAKATTYRWFFLDSNGKWIKYGEVDSLGNINMIPSLSSDEIEHNFCLDPSSPLAFKNSKFRYLLDFTEMKQKNLETGKERLVRRRPLKRESTRPNVRSSDEELPSNWDKMKETDLMLQVTLDVLSQEYRDIISLVHLTLPSAKIVTVKRIQNPILWRPFKYKQTALSLKYGGDSHLNVQKFFHGTSAEHIDSICRENFDWRLYGSNVGVAYGKGAYFSNSAPVSLKYAPCDSSGHRFLVLADVIVGKITRGNQSMRRPPKNPATVVMAGGGSGEDVGVAPARGTTGPREAMTKDQVSIPLTDGSLVGVVGPALAAVMVGIGLWIGVVFYLSRPTQVWKKNSHRRTNLVETLADTVERGVAQQAQKQSSPGAPPPQQKAKHPHQWGQGRRPDYRQKVGGTRRPQIEEDLPDGEQSHTRQEMAWTRSRDPTRSRPHDTTDHPRQPLQDATTTLVVVGPEKNFDGQTRPPGGEGEGKKRGYKVRSSFRPPSDPDLRDISDSAFYGRFVRLEREEQDGDSVAYQFERPGLAASQIRQRVVAPRHDTQHHLQQPSGHPARRRRPPSPSGDVSHFEDPSGKDPRPFQTPVGGATSHKRPSGLPQRPNKGRPHTTPREEEVYLKPPLELLNPKPNTWRGSGINQLPSRRHSHLWNRNVSLDEGQHILDEGDTPIPPSSHASYPGTSTLLAAPPPPPAPSVSTPLEDGQVDKTSSTSATTSATALLHHELGYREIISALRFANGVAINWIPDKDKEDSRDVSKDTEEK
ncbi:uncharacterized protein [Panulirus ornatus]|uniref:uncharacterized protein n=1 Tax=Panulirus ornatus TaxID=150431 RepID=UPI003A88187A